jgi:hypothetical protein
VVVDPEFRSGITDIYFSNIGRFWYISGKETHDDYVSSVRTENCSSTIDKLASASEILPCSKTKQETVESRLKLFFILSLHYSQGIRLSERPVTI